MLHTASDSAIVPFSYRNGFMKLCTQDCQGNTLLHTSLQSRNQSVTSSILNYMTEELTVIVFHEH